MATEPPENPPTSPASADDFEWPPRSDDLDKMFVPVEAVGDISALRPGWRHSSDPLPHTLTGAVGIRGGAGPPGSRRLRTLPPAETHSRRPSRGRRVLIAAVTVTLAVVITLPWLLVWRGAHTSNVPLPALPREAIAAASVVPTAPALLRAIRLPLEFRPAPQPAFQARSAATVVHALLIAEQAAIAEPVSLALPAPASPVANRERATPPAPPAPVPSSSPTVAAPPDPPALVDAQPSAAASPSPLPLSTATPAPPPKPAPAPTPTPAAAAPPSPAATAIPTDERQVTTTLRQYALAFEQLDATAVARVWPGADQRALSRAFDAIEFQEVSLDTCNVRVSGGTAVADCDGRITYVPKVGKKDPRLVVRRWDFALQKNGDAWTITTAAVR